MLNFPTDLDRAGTTTLMVHDEVATVTDTVTIHRMSQRPEQGRAFLGRDVEKWGWEDLRDYVVSQVEQRFGAFPRDPRKERGIFSSFLSRWETQSVSIARFAFEQCDGVWKGAPISIYRFCKKSDPYFAQPIAERLAD